MGLGLAISRSIVEAHGGAALGCAAQSIWNSILHQVPAHFEKGSAIGASV
jgi:signal transduction histidine kinase